MRFTQTAPGPRYCDTGPRAGMFRYDGILYLTAAESARLDLTGEFLPVAAEQFELRDSGDGVKTDLELTCAGCGERLCDAEAGDDMAVLARMTSEHQCGVTA